MVPYCRQSPTPGGQMEPTVMTRRTIIKATSCACSLIFGACFSLVGAALFLGLTGDVQLSVYVFWAEFFVCCVITWNGGWAESFGNLFRAPTFWIIYLINSVIQSMIES